MEAYRHALGRRVTPRRIAGHVGERTGLTPVYGFLEVAGQGDAIAGVERLRGGLRAGPTDASENQQEGCCHDHR